MDIPPKYVLFLAALFFLSSHPKIRMVQCQLLPIISEQEQVGNGTEVQVYIVHVQKPKSTKFLTFLDRKNWYLSFLPNTTLPSGERRMLYAYRHVISGFAARLMPDELKAVESMDGFVLAYPEAEYEGLTTYTPKFLGLTDWNTGFWSTSNMGDGKIIGVIDSGIKPTHPSFKDHNMAPAPPSWSGQCYWGAPICNKKLIGAVGYKNGRTFSPLDDHGHGTHVAGTAAGNFVDNAQVLGFANGTASGTAPRAHLAIYKCLHDNGKGGTVGSSGDILAAIDQAIRDGVDVLSMSLGSTKVPFSQSSVAISSFAAMARDIFPCAAAANDGPAKSIIANDAPWITTVGASTVGRKIMAAVRLGNGVELPGQSLYQPSTFDSSVQLPIVYPFNILKTIDAAACDMDLSSLNVQGKIVFCLIGQIDEDEKGKNVLKAGGAAMVVFTGGNVGDWTIPHNHVLPAATVGFRVAVKIVSYFNQTTNPTATIVFKGTQLGISPVPAVGSFSSRGPSLHNGGIIKPDVIAPGVNIVAAWPKDISPNPSSTKTKTFNFESGTSMATPHVSGIVALLKNARPTWSPAAIRSAIMTTAYTMDRDGNPITDQYDDLKSNGTASVFARGSGHVDPLAALNPGLVYDLQFYNYVHYLCGLGLSNGQISAIARGSVNCANVRSIRPEQLNYPSFMAYLGQNTNSITVKRTVKNVGDPNSVYKVQYDEPRGVRVDVNPNILHFTKRDEELDFQVTFSLKGAPLSRGEVSEGQLAWDSGKYFVRSPIAISFI